MLDWRLPQRCRERRPTYGLTGPCVRSTASATTHQVNLLNGRLIRRLKGRPRDVGCVGASTPGRRTAGHP